MSQKVLVSLEAIIDLLKDLSEKEKEIIFEKVFLEEDTSPLTPEEINSLEAAEKELKNGETISWPFGK